MIKISEKTTPLSRLKTTFNLKSLMKSLTILFLIIPSFTLEAKENLIAQLINIKNNSSLNYQKTEFTFLCEPYGLLSVDQVLSDEKSNNHCKNSVKKFYQNHLELEYLAYEYLKVKQFYHLKFKNKQCLIYAQGLKTYSEILLQEGLALLSKGFKDEEFLYEFQKAQEGAKLNKKGIYSDKEVLDCVNSLQ